MTTQTVEATYVNWKIKFNEKINAKNAKLYIIAISEEISNSSDCEELVWSKEFLWTELHKRWKKLLFNI